uniref:exodeoxyribonuclease III n=1 Tax=Sander lucioperca TaxID=283035 RepID=A0A8C9XSY8_SANLU
MLRGPSKHSEGGVNLVSWNVRGMNSPLKRGKVYAHIRTLKADICFLQETHIKKTAAKVLCPPWASHVFQSNFSTKARGVAILIKKNTPFVHMQTISDDRGRYLLVKGELNSVPVTLINIYGPNFDDPIFFQNLFNTISNMSNTNIILGGDFNCVLDPVLDRQHSQINTSRSSIALNNLIQSYNLVDIWRPIFHLYPNLDVILTWSLHIVLSPCYLSKRKFLGKS